jgi:hypothetical protein
MTDGPYRVVLRARHDGMNQVFLFNGKKRIFCIPFHNPKAAEFMAAKVVDELLRNRHEFSCAVQDEDGRSIPIDLVLVAQRRKVRGS